MIIDNICSILNESVTALTSIGDSLSTIALFDTLVKDTTSFLLLAMQLIGEYQLILCVILWYLHLNKLILIS